MKNENGASLITVLLIITLISVFSLVIVNSTFNSRLQINSTEKINVATDIAEMGMTHYYTLFTKLSQNAYSETSNYINDWIIKYKRDNKDKDPTQQEIIKKFNEVYNSNLMNNIEVNTSYNPSFHVENEKYQINIINPLYLKNFSTLEIIFTSKGYFKEQEEELIGTITLNKTEPTKVDSINRPEPNNFKYIEKSRIFKEYYDGSVYFQELIKMNGNSRELIINGDAFFPKGLILNGNITLKVLGNVYFYDVIKNGVSGNICISGNTYRVNNSSIKQEAFPGNSCSPLIEGKWDPSTIKLNVEYK